MIPLHASILDPGQQVRLEGLARELTAAQLAWASGYLAGLAAHGAAPVDQPAAGAEAARQVTVLFGSETGNARGLAERIGRQLADKGTASRVLSMGEYKPRNLKDEHLLIVVTATHGEGDPPESARGFFEFLMGRKAPKLEGLHYAVLGLGDSSYEYFCRTAKDIDARLEQLGATCIHARVDCDVDFEGAASAWIGEVTPIIEKLAGPAPPSAVVLTHPFAHAGEASGPVAATVIEHIRLNGRGSDKVTCHIEFDVSDTSLRHLPGDSLGVLVENDPALVAELVGELGLSPNAELSQALLTGFELTILTPNFIEAYARAGGIEPLARLHADKDRNALRRYMENRQIVDVVREYPARGLPAEQFTGLLRKLEPRLYSIASSAEAVPGEIHITVAEVNFRSSFAERFGTASGRLCRRTAPGATFQVHVERNEQFRLPEDPQAPLIMIGAGTGVAPYRAFMQEREVQEARGRSWFFFGERRFRTDFLYQAEWQQYLREGWLTRMDLAFSRDQAQKIYVQDRLRERGHEVYGWLQEGAYLYVCGDAKNMAPDVQAALIDIVATHGGKDQESAREYLNELTLERRYRRDVY